MKKVNFKKIYAENFLCFGNKGVTIDFKNYNNIVLIRGKNLDIAESTNFTEKYSSNGSGKSSIPAILVYGLFGKTIRKPNKIGHKDVINHISGKKLKVEVYWDDYKLQRTRKPDALRLWKSTNQTWDDSTEITLGGMPATQKLAEDIVGMSYETFINVAIFTDDNTSSFLECDASEKRQIVENLLSLEKYRTYHENAKKLLKIHKDNVKILEREIQYIDMSFSEETSNLQRLINSQSDWKALKKADIDNIQKLLLVYEEDKKKALENDFELIKYEKILVEIAEGERKIIDIDDGIPKLERNEAIFAGALSKTKLAYDEKIIICNNYKNDIKNIQNNLNKIKQNISKIENLEDGVQCQYCLEVVDKNSHDTILKNYQNEQSVEQEKLTEVNSLYLENKEQFEKHTEDINALEKKQIHLITLIKKYKTEKDSINKKINELLKIKKPEENANVKVAQQNIEILKSKLIEKITEARSPSPFDILIKTSKTNIDSIEANKSTKETVLIDLIIKNKYYDYWILAFGDSGIRKYVIDEIVPALNSNIRYWMQFLIENKISLSFNNEFEELIEKYPTDGSSYLYECMSNGQRRRINLALSQAFAHVMSLNSGNTPNIVFLDEVTSNVDSQGVSGIYNMICELAKDKQVFVTTHDHDLMDFLNGCDTIDLVMENGITKIEK